MSKLVSMATMATKFLSAGATFVMTLVIIRSLEKNQAGTIFVCIAITAILSALARLGLENVVTRYVAAFAADKSWGNINLLYRKVIGAVAVAGLLLTCGSIFSAPFINDLFFDDDLFVRVFPIVAGQILPAALCWIHACFYQGTGDTVRFQLLQTLLTTLVFLAVWGIILNFFDSLISPILCAAVLTAANWVACAAAFASWSISRKTAALPTDLQIPFVKTARPLLGIMLIQQLLVWAPQIFIGIFGRMEDAAIFNAALRSANVVGIVLAGFNSLVFPRFAALHSKNRLDELRATVFLVTRAITISCIPILFAIFALAGTVLGLFRNDFDAAVPILQILILGQLVNVITGPVGGLLMMTGHERAAFRCTVHSLIVMLVTQGTLVPLWGLWGAAVSQILTLMAYMISMTWTCSTVLGFAPVNAFYTRIATDR